MAPGTRDRRDGVTTKTVINPWMEFRRNFKMIKESHNQPIISPNIIAFRPYQITHFKIAKIQLRKGFLTLSKLISKLAL